MSGVQEFDAIRSRIRAVQWDGDDATFRDALTDLLAPCELVGDGAMIENEWDEVVAFLDGYCTLTLKAPDRSEVPVVEGDWVLAGNSGYPALLSDAVFKEQFRPVSSCEIVEVTAVTGSMYQSKAVRWDGTEDAFRRCIRELLRPCRIVELNGGLLLAATDLSGDSTAEWQGGVLRVFMFLRGGGDWQTVCDGDWVVLDESGFPMGFEPDEFEAKFEVSQP